MNLDKKIFFLSDIINTIGFILCLFSFLFTYYYFKLLNYNILILSFFTFQFGISLKVGTIITNFIRKKL